MSSPSVKPKVLFATKCYGKDYLPFLSSAFTHKYKSIGYPFDGTVLMLNNGIPEDMKWALTGANGFTLDVEPALPIVYEHFGLTDESFEGGKWYSVAELTALFYAQEEGYDYLCWVQGDCLAQDDWVEEGIEILESNPDIAVVSPWSDVNTWHDNDGLDHYMSDQAFLVRVKEFAQKDVYHYPGTDSDYPSYGGNSFEHMVGKYLKATKRFRKILINYWCTHETV